MDAVVSAVSHAEDPHQAVAELATALRRDDIDFVLFFCAASYPLQQVAAALSRQCVGITVAGCTSAGEISDQGYCARSITALGFSSRYFRVEGLLLRGLAEQNLDRLQNRVSSLVARSQSSAIAPLSGHTFAMTLTDGLSVLEEQVLSLLNVALAGLPQFGASAADHSFSGVSTWVFLDGEFHSDAMVVLLFNTPCDFKVFSRHHLVPGDGKLVVTDGDSAARIAHEFNAEPAVSVYSEHCGQPPEAFSAATSALYPLAVRLREQYYVRGVRQLEPDGSVAFYSAIETGAVLTPMHRLDLRQHLAQMLDELEMELGTPQLVIGCDCLLRRVEAEALGQENEISDIFRRFRVIGFSTYGEHFSGMVFNQTFTGVAIGQIPND